MPAKEDKIAKELDTEIREKTDGKYRVVDQGFLYELGFFCDSIKLVGEDAPSEAVKNLTVHMAALFSEYIRYYCNSDEYKNLAIRRIKEVFHDKHTGN